MCVYVPSRRNKLIKVKTSQKKSLFSLRHFPGCELIIRLPHRWPRQMASSTGLCRYGARVDCCWGWTRRSWGHCQREYHHACYCCCCRGQTGLTRLPGLRLESEMPLDSGGNVTMPLWGWTHTYTHKHTHIELEKKNTIPACTVHFKTQQKHT